MAKKKKVEATEKVVQEQVDNVTKVNLNKTEESNVTKVDLSKPPSEEVVAEESPVEEIVEEVVEEKQPETEVETLVLEEITDEEVQEEVEELTEQVEEAVAEAEATGKPIPENIQKLMEFMEDTGGDLEDYVKLNQDFSELDNNSILKEYYKQTKPHLDSEEIDFLMEDTFSFDEELDEERDVRRKKLALKEQVAQAKQHLDGAKSKYYEDIKSGSKLTGEQQKAIDFFNRYKTESKEQEEVAGKQKSTFLNKTNKLFNKEFKGFEYNVGEKKFRFNVKDSDTVKDTQSDINNFVKKFLNKNNEMEDAKGYHKSMYTAMNPDKIASHFYEQGKADAVKDVINRSKNLTDTKARTGSSGDITVGGFKVKAISGFDSSKLKIQKRKFN